MRKINVLIMLSLASLLAACNSSGGKEAAPGGSELSGTVSSVINFLNPLSSAYASDSVCVPVFGNDKVKVYTINPADGSKTLACSTHLAADNSFKATIHDDQIPAGHHLKIEADLGGGVVREAVVNMADKSDIIVDPSSTMAVPLALEELKSNESADLRSVREKVRSFVQSSGVSFSAISSQDVAKLKTIFENSLSSAKECIFEGGQRKEQFGAFLKNRFEDRHITVSGDAHREASLTSSLEFH
jgi:hypothetical protein